MKYATALLVASAQAAWPAYTTVTVSSPATAVEMQTIGGNGYTCLRNNLMMVYQYALSPAYNTDPASIG